jgi:YHS domain-containing protein
MESLLYFLLWAVVIVAIMRFGCGAHIFGHRRHAGHDRAAERGGEARWVPPERDVDPVCGMTIATAGARSSVHGGRVFYFCSADCRDKFEASPDRYLAAAKGASPSKEHYHD